MSINDYKSRRDLVHDLLIQIEDLNRDVAALSRELDAAHIEIEKLNEAIKDFHATPTYLPESHPTTIHEKRCSDRRKNCVSRRSAQREAETIDRRLGDRRTVVQTRFSQASQHAI